MKKVLTRVEYLDSASACLPASLLGVLRTLRVGILDGFSADYQQVGFQSEVALLHLSGNSISEES